ncbi:MAG: long-chain-fatty-acid--CoA ligase [Chloroflexota bacterium]
MEERPWFRFWPKGVPKHLKYLEVPLFMLLSRAAQQWPDSIAFSCQERSLTYKELDEVTSKLGAGLRDQAGIKKGNRVMLFLPNGLEFIIGYYGALKAGATVTTANPLYREGELTHQLNDTKTKAIISNRALHPLIKGVREGTSLETIVLTDNESDDTLSLSGIIEKQVATVAGVSIEPKNDVAVIVYTGGTTGLPKGVLLTHYNLVANAMQNATWFGWTPNDTVVALLPFYHSWGASTGINSPIYSGAKTTILPRFDPEELLKTVEEQKATVIYGAATMFTALVNSPAIGDYDLSSLRYVKAGAMPIPPKIKTQWEEMTGIKMDLGYGLSEASPETHNSPLDRVKDQTIGIPVMDTDARIVDEETGNIELPTGQMGELIVQGPQVMKGYLDRPEDTAAALRDGWLYTGDLGVMDEEGYFQILDRKKETINYKGYTIAPAEVEAILYEHPSVQECCVVGKPDPAAGEIPKAFVVLQQGHTADKEELIQFCGARIAPYKRIREVEFVDKIPKTPVGKVLRRVLRDRDRKR